MDINIIANDEVGAEFLRGMAGYGRIARKHAALLEKFSAWHLHDGWITVGYKSGAHVVSCPVINILWLMNRGGSSHSCRLPVKGDRVLIIDALPLDEKEVIKPFKVYAYTVISIGEKMFLKEDPYYTLGREKEMLIRFNTETQAYEEYTNPSLKNKILFKLQKLLA